MREPSKGFNRELQVGLFVFAAALVMMAFSFRITDSPLFRRGSTFVTYLDDATGIFKNSKVKLAGIDIGVIRKIELEEGMAKITMTVDKGIEVPAGSQIVPRPLGILGDKYLDIVLPGKGEGSELKPVLPPENAVSPEPAQETSPASSVDPWRFFGIAPAYAQAPRTIPQAKPGATPPAAQQTDSKGQKVLPAIQSPATLDDLTRQLGKVGEDLKVISGTLRTVVEGEGNQKSPIGRTLKNAENLTKNLNEVVVENRRDLRSIVKSLDTMTRKLNETVAAFDQQKMSQDLKNLADAAGNMSKSVANLEKITTKIADGEGSLGRLVNDESVAVELEKALRTINTTLDRAQRTLTVVELRTEYLESSQEWKTYAGLSIYPREDTGYLGFVVVDPRGTVKTTVTQETVNNGTPTTTETVVNEKDELKFSLQYYRRFWHLGVRIGLFESTGGFGTDLFMLDDRIRVGAEIFDFSRDGERANLKVNVAVRFLNYFYLAGGGNELLARNADGAAVQRSWYAGIGIRFSDEDLKTVALLPGI